MGDADRIIGAILFTSIVAAQPLGQAAFEVASIKLVATAAPGPIPKPTICGLGAGGRFQAFGWMRFFVACAYETGFGKIDDFILGGPSWMEGEYYEINARLTTDAAPLSQANGFAALRALLTDRCKLSLHREMRESSMYALVAAKHGGPGLRRADASCVDRRCGRDIIGPSLIRSRAMTMTQLATLLSPRVGRRVEDRTGLSGVYDVNLEWKPALMVAPQNDAGGSSVLPADPAPAPIVGAVEEQLGLKLQSIKGTSEVIVIDHIERPSPN